MVGYIVHAIELYYVYLELGVKEGLQMAGVKRMHCSVLRNEP